MAGRPKLLFWGQQRRFDLEDGKIKGDRIWFVGAGMSLVNSNATSPGLTPGLDKEIHEWIHWM